MKERARGSTRVIEISGTFAILLGSSTIYAWFVHDWRLLQIRPDLHWVAMAFNTGVCFVSTGLAMFAVSRERTRWIPLLVLFPLVAAILGLVEHSTGADLGIDQLLMRQDDTPRGWDGTAHPGRMAPQTCLSFLMTSAVLLFYHLASGLPARPAVVGSVGSVLASMGVVGACGYVLGVDTYHWLHFHPIAVHTATGLTVVGVGLVAAAWRDRPAGGGLPAWAPLPVGAAVATVTMCVQLALRSKLAPYVPDIAFAAGMTMAVLCALIIHMLRIAHRNLELARTTAARLLAATEDIRRAGSTQRRGTDELVEAIRETSTAVTEITTMSSRVGGLTTDMERSMQEAGKIGDEGDAQVIGSVAAMRRARDEVEASVTRLRKLTEVLEAVHEIVESVDRVSMQTKVLSVNAALEATGDGRPVVFHAIAKEVGQLAELSQDGGRRIRSMLAEIGEASDLAVVSAQRGAIAVEEASRIITGAGETIASLTATLTRAIQVSVEIQSAAGDQSVAMTRIQRAMQDVEGTTRASLESIRDLQETASRLSALSGELDRIASSGRPG